MFYNFDKSNMDTHQFISAIQNKAIRLSNIKQYEDFVQENCDLSLEEMIYQ